MMEPNEKAVIVIIIGLLAIDALLWGGIMGRWAFRGVIDPTLVMAAGSIPSGLIGFIGSTPRRPGPGVTSVAAPDNTTSDAQAPQKAS